MEWQLVFEYLLENSASIITIIVVLLCRLLGQTKTAEEVEKIAQAKAEKKREKKAMKAQKLLAKASQLVPELNEKEKGE